MTIFHLKETDSMTKRRSTLIALTLAAAAGATLLTGCSSDADNASYNLGRSAEQFEVNRRITVFHGVTGEVTLEVEGRCSVETAESALEGGVEITCKIAPNEYVKHTTIPGINGQVDIQQLDTTDVSLYHHRVIIKPENLLPEFDYESGEQ